MSAGRYIIVKGRAGLGNRMLAVLGGALYAKLSGRRLVVDWTDWHFADPGQNVYSFLFDSPAESVSAVSQDLPVVPSVWAGHLGVAASDRCDQLFPKRLHDYSVVFDTSIDVARLDYPEPIVVFWAWDQQIWRMRRHLRRALPELRGQSDWQIMKELAAQYLRPSALVRAQADAFKAEHFRGPVVGVHVRYTDRKVPLDAIHRGVGAALKRRPGARVFLATDSEIVQKEFVARYPDVLVRPKDFRSGGQPLHMDYWANGKNARAADALTEMLLLAECDALIYAQRSSFSHVAHLLSSMNERDVVDVDRRNLMLLGKRIAQGRLSRVAHRLRSIFPAAAPPAPAVTAPATR